MEKSSPDKWIRKAIGDELDGIIVSGETINVYDSRVVAPDFPDHYILLSTQSKETDKDNKCEWFWDSSVLIEVFTIFKRSGNYGSRLLADDIMDEVRQGVNDMSLDVASGLAIITKTQSYPDDITTVTDSEIVFRKLLRLNLLIK